KADGSVVVWGRNDYGECVVPEPNQDFIAISGGYTHCMGLKADGSVVVWGNNLYGQCNVPEPNDDFVAIAAGSHHCTGLKSDGSLVAWGANFYGQCDIPYPNGDFLKIFSRFHTSIALRSGSTTAVAFSRLVAEAFEGVVRLGWETEADEALTGFDLYRAEIPGDPVKITESPLPSFARNYEDRTSRPGMDYRYTVAAILEDGREIYSYEVTVSNDMPSLVLFQNSPNPFNPSTTIRYYLRGRSPVHLEIFDVSGRRVSRLVDRIQDPGPYTIVWDGKDDEGDRVSSGIYIYRLKAGKETLSKKMVLLR
ncbi:MAG TPA: FlgD immunoglobulin-like domain containing protein, partial [Candidatus Krumholzibacterium sp.]|nr:FlgD immunoglobulin-like domain containing protein [Candidatus Krumholzibacterium sp.]